MELKRTYTKQMKDVQTPFYLFDIPKLKERIAYLRDHLSKGVSICYAIKANTFILGRIAGEIDRFEVCSPGEFRICQAQRLPMEKLVISGVYKTPELMEEIIRKRAGVGMYTVESMEQMRLLASLAERYQASVDLLLRLTSGNQFGMEEAQIAEIVKTYRRHPLIRIRGIQYFSGTQKKSIKRLRKELEYVDSFMKDLRAKTGVAVPELEFGPGFPVMYFAGEEFDEEEFLAGFSGLLEELTCGAKVTLELGRSIAAGCGSYYTSVVDTKTNRGQNYAIVDGGIHQLVYYGQSMAMKRPMLAVIPREEASAMGMPPGRATERAIKRMFQKEMEHEDELQHWNLFGSLCTINDILAKQLPLPDLKKGDVIVFENTGAYAMTEGISLFLSRDLPGVLLREEDGSVTCLRDQIPTYPLNQPQRAKSDAGIKAEDPVTEDRSKKERSIDHNGKIDGTIGRFTA